jgi:hypothetical protein
MGFTVKAFIFIAIFYFASVFFTIGLISAFGVSSGIQMPEFPRAPKDFNWLNPLSYAAIFSFVWSVISYIITSAAHFGILVFSLPTPLNILSVLFGLFFFVVLIEWVRG